MARGAGGETKPQRIAAAVKRAVRAGEPMQFETVDFGDPNRPRTCLEVDFPLLPVNQVAQIEGNAGKPIYQMSKWWARRRSSVFRSMLLAATMKAPDDPAEAAKAVWDAYYRNHQSNAALQKISVLDPFMGGGTTVVEGSRLGLTMRGVDLNPVAWLIVKNELADVTRAEIDALLADIEAEAKPQLAPFYACPGPGGERGKWTRVATGDVMGPTFDPFAVPPAERRQYRYDGPELVYAFWAKHGPCQRLGCGHRTPLFSSPVVAVKELTVKARAHTCKGCRTSFDIEEQAARMAPDVPLAVAPDEPAFAVIDRTGGVTCPHCSHHERIAPNGGAVTKKKVALTLLVHPSWLAGAGAKGLDGKVYGGRVTDTAADTAAWNKARASTLRLLELRGALPKTVVCPETHVTIDTEAGTIPKEGHFTCALCGTQQRTVLSMQASGGSAPVSAFALQAYSPSRDRGGETYRGRFFGVPDNTAAIEAAHAEWDSRKDGDLAGYWPRSVIPFGHMTHQRQPLPQHGYLRWSDMFNPRQLLVQSVLLKTIVEVGGERHRWAAREFVLGAFQQYLRNQCMFTLWNTQADKLEPMFANNNFHPRSNVVENSVFAPIGRGNWISCVEGLGESTDWKNDPTESLPKAQLARVAPAAAGEIGGAGTSARTRDPVRPATLHNGSATDLTTVSTGSIDLVITDPPFGGLLHYSELSDFFYVWLRLALKDRYPESFGPEYTPKTLEVVANRAREPVDPDAFYQRLLTEAWRESHRVLKPGGILAFTFHHSEDAPWVSVLESLFDAGFYLEQTYPIRSDEKKGDGEFGSKTIEFDIIHVCRKRTVAPLRVSWARLRRQILADVRALQGVLEHHRREHLGEADLQVIRRGKALEYYSRHYEHVYVDEGRPLSVREVLAGINQILAEEASTTTEAPPRTAEPYTSLLLRLFDKVASLPTDQVQKHLRGTGVAPSEFESRGWTHEEKKVVHVVPPLELARAWQAKGKARPTSDYDQAMLLIGGCFEGSGVDVKATLNKDGFAAHVALQPVVEWFTTHGATPAIRNAATTAARILRVWQSEHQELRVKQGWLLDDGVEAAA
jgi:putative DNA methylase